MTHSPHVATVRGSMSPPPTLPPASTPAPVTIQTMHTAGNTAALTIHEPLTTLSRGNDPWRADEPAIADAVDLITHPAGETTALTTHESITHELSSPQLLQPHRDAALWLAQSTAVTTTRGSARSETHNFWCVACQLWLNSGCVLIFSCNTERHTAPALHSVCGFCDAAHLPNEGTSGFSRCPMCFPPSPPSESITCSNAAVAAESRHATSVHHGVAAQPTACPNMPYSHPTDAPLSTIPDEPLLYRPALSVGGIAALVRDFDSRLAAGRPPAERTLRLQVMRRIREPGQAGHRTILIVHDGVNAIECQLSLKLERLWIGEPNKPWWVDGLGPLIAFSATNCTALRYLTGQPLIRIRAGGMVEAIRLIHKPPGLQWAQQGVPSWLPTIPHPPHLPSAPPPPPPMPPPPPTPSRKRFRRHTLIEYSRPCRVLQKLGYCVLCKDADKAKMSNFSELKVLKVRG